MHNIKKTFDRFYLIIRNLLKDSIDRNGNFHKVGRRPKFSDTEVIALSLTSEALSIDSENNLFMKLNTEYKKQFPNLIQRRKLFFKIEEVRKTFADKIINAFLLGDKGYVSEEIQIDLFHSEHITLQTPLRSNQDKYKKQPYILRKSRKRIETLFSQLCDQFMIRRNYAKSFDGFRTRIISKISALTILQYINKFFNN